MPSRKGLEQSLTWLKSKMAEKDTLDAINAELCYNVIIDLKKRKEAIGAMYHLASEAKKEKSQELDRLLAAGGICFRDYIHEKTKGS